MSTILAICFCVLFEKNPRFARNNSCSVEQPPHTPGTQHRGVSVFDECRALIGLFTTFKLVLVCLQRV